MRPGVDTAAIAARVMDLGSERDPPVSVPPRVGDAASSFSLPLFCVRTYMELAQLSSSSGRYLTSCYNYSAWDAWAAYSPSTSSSFPPKSVIIAGFIFFFLPSGLPPPAT